MHIHMYHEYESVYEYGSNAFELNRYISQSWSRYILKGYHNRPILSLIGQKTISWCLTSFQFLAYDTSKSTKVCVVFIFFIKILHWSSQKYTLEWIKVGNDMMSDTANGPSNWELVTVVIWPVLIYRRLTCFK